jgi:hypothetical protein
MVIQVKIYLLKLFSSYLKSKEFLLIPLKRYPGFYCQDGLFSSHSPKLFQQPEFRESISYASSFTGARYDIDWRTHVFHFFAKYACRLKGEFVELGTGKGWMIASALNFVPELKFRQIWLFDRFSPNAVDPITGATLESSGGGLTQITLNPFKFNLNLGKTSS